MVNYNAPTDSLPVGIQNGQINLREGCRQRLSKKKALRNNILYYQPQIMEDLELKLADTPFNKYIEKECHREKVMHFISHLYLVPILDDRYDKDSYIYVSSDNFLKTMYGTSHYPKIIKALEYASVIETDSSYKVSASTKSYKISDRYAGCIFKGYALKRGSRISKKIDAFNDIGLSERKHKRVYENLKKELQCMTVDFEGAAEFLMRKAVASLDNPISVIVENQRVKYTKGGRLIFPKKLSPTERQEQYVNYLNAAESIIGREVTVSEELTMERLKKIVNSYKSNLMAITKIKDKQFFFTLDGNERLHTNLTNLSSDIRNNFIYLNGEKIIGTDLSNSQPTFLALLLLKKYRKNRPEDIQRYIDLCLSGNFYNHMMERAGVPEDSRKQYKQEFKDLLFEKIFFGRVPKKSLSKPAKDIKEAFPTVYSFIIEMKSDFEMFNEDTAHTKLANQLQNMEQSIIVLQSARECLRRGIPILTLHDALYSTDEHIEEVCDIIISRFEKEYGVVPQLIPSR